MGKKRLEERLKGVVLKGVSPQMRNYRFYMDNKNYRMNKQREQKYKK